MEAANNLFLVMVREGQSIGAHGGWGRDWGGGGREAGPGDEGRGWVGGAEGRWWGKGAKG